MKIYLKTIFALLCLLSVGQQALADHWTCKESDFRNDMTLYFSPVVDGQSLTSLDGYEIAAFVGDECRGTAEIVNVAGKGSYGYVRVRSNKDSGETVSFKLYRASDRQEVVSDYTLAFSKEGVVGMPSSPQEIAFKCKYSLKYMVGEELYKEYTITYGDATQTPSDPVKEGYRFDGWNQDIPATMPAGNLEIVAQFSVLSYTLKYVYTKESVENVVSSESVEFGTPLTKKANPEIQGWVFSGWQNEPETMPARDVTVTGSFSKGSYILTYYVDGKVYQTIGHEVGDEITSLEVPTKEGYTFFGWQNEPTTMPGENTRVDGYFTINQYNVKFVADGQTVKEEKLDFGTVIVVPADPTKEGHTFTGWNPTVDATIPAHDVTYTAQFAVNSYTLTYKVDGKVQKTATVEFGTVITPEPAPTKVGHTFSGWDNEPETMPANDVVVTGTFTKNKHNIIYYVDGKEYKRVELEYGEQIVVEPAPYEEGYTFSGWGTTPKTMPDNDVELKGTFTLNQYKVTFVADGETVHEAALDFGAAITAPENPTKTGYTFTGWAPAVDATVPAHDVTYTAQFTVNQYKVTFVVDGKSIKEETLEYGSAITAPAGPEKEGHTFTGWSPTVDATVPARDVTYTAQFSVNKYTLKYVYTKDGVDTEYSSEQVEFGTALTKKSDLEETGYVFSGWSELPATMPARDVTVTGTFTKGAYKLTYYVDYVFYKTVAYDYGATITPEAEPTKEGYTFSGWSEIPATMPANDVRVDGTFTVNQYTITFETDGGTEVVAITQDYGTAVTKPADPTKIGYTFDGWDKEIPSTMPAENMTITAQWTINQYTITFDTDGGTEIEAITQDYGTAVTVPNDPKRIGYTFTGWDKEIPETMPAENITIKAQWQINSYNLTYKVDGEVYTEYTVEYGAEITPEPAPTKEGYTFTGWSEIPETMPAHDVEVTGEFVIATLINNLVRPGSIVTIYDYRGLRVKENHRVGEPLNLPSGIYIINGQKLVVK